MPWRYYAGMTDMDKRALIAALRAASTVLNAVLAPTLHAERASSVSGVSFTP